MQARLSILILAALAVAGVWLFARKAASPPFSAAEKPAVDKKVPTGPGEPILIELFTSEGCSSCPPADQLLAKFDMQPVAGAHLIVLSEHVDYWNHIGWTDPFSSAAYSARQNQYGDRFHLESVYTPQMIVDGSSEFVGNSDGDARKAFAKSEAHSKVDVQISDLAIKNGNLMAHVESAGLPANSRSADVVFVVALNHAESEVAGGENAGRKLTHVAVVRSLNVVGTAESGKPFSKDVSVPLGKDISADNLRAVAFLQESGQGRVVGAAEATLPR